MHGKNTQQVSDSLRVPVSLFQQLLSMDMLYTQQVFTSLWGHVFNTNMFYALPVTPSTIPTADLSIERNHQSQAAVSTSEAWHGRVPGCKLLDKKP